MDLKYGDCGCLLGDKAHFIDDVETVKIICEDCLGVYKNGGAKLIETCYRNSMGEYRFCKPEVVGSSPTDSL